jgi:hypothetical protein
MLMVTQGSPFRPAQTQASIGWLILLLLLPSASAAMPCHIFSSPWALFAAKRLNLCGLLSAEFLHSLLFFLPDSAPLEE